MRKEFYTADNNANNYTTWMLWQSMDNETDYVQLVSATNALSSNSTIYSNLTASKPLTQKYNVFRQTALGSTSLKVASETLKEGISMNDEWHFLINKVLDGKVMDKPCDIVAIYTPGTTHYYLDFSKAIANQNNSVTLESSQAYRNQLFFLEPIDPHFSGLTAPTADSINLQQTTSMRELSNIRWWTTKNWYWSWTDTADTILKDDPHAYRYQTATLNNNNAWTYGSWTDWADYTSANTITSGYNRWAKDPITVPECSDSVKKVGAQIQMYTHRDVTALGKTTRFTSPTVSRWTYFAKKPTLAKDGLSWTPEGLKINFSSDYFGQGFMSLKFSSIAAVHPHNRPGGIIQLYSFEEILMNSFTTSIVLDSTVTIPTSYFSRPPSLNEILRISVYVDTDLYAPGNAKYSLEDVVSYDEGNVDVAPTITKLDGLRYQADVPYADTVKMWMSVDGQTYEIEGTVSNGHTIFEIMPPFMTDYALFTSYENSDKTIWGTAYTPMEKINIRAHCFTWNGDSVVIWLNKDTALTESFTFSPQSTTHTLAGRSHDVVTYLSDGEKNYTSVTGDIKGYIVPQCETYGTTKESIEKMVEQGHVVYRAPYGRVCNVAVTGADITTDKGITEVSVSIVQEDDDQENSGGMSELY